MQDNNPPRTICALFVGIDAYPAPVRPLNGCVDDVTRLCHLLEERVKGSNDRFAPKLLADAAVTVFGASQAAGGLIWRPARSTLADGWTVEGWIVHRTPGGTALLATV